MKFTQRTAHNGAIALSLIFFAVVVVEWQRGRSGYAEVIRSVTTFPPDGSMHNSTVEVGSYLGLMEFAARATNDRDRHADDDERAATPIGAVWYWKRGSERYYENRGMELSIRFDVDGGKTKNGCEMWAPHWFLAVLFGSLPAWTVIRWIMRVFDRRRDTSMGRGVPAGPSVPLRAFGNPLASRIVNVFTLISAAFCIILMMFWVRAGTRTDVFQFTRNFESPERLNDHLVLIQSDGWGIKFLVSLAKVETREAIHYRSETMRQCGVSREAPDPRWTDGAYKERLAFYSASHARQLPRGPTLLCFCLTALP